MEQNDIVIIAAKRTPTGNLMGALSSLSAPKLGAKAHLAALEQAGLNKEDVDEVIYGCVLQAGIGQAPARQSAKYAGFPNQIGATTLNKMCGSGMKSVMLAHDMIQAGSAKVILAGGMESMSNAPYLLDKARGGYRLGHGQLKDHMFLDGLEDAYDRGKLMGVFAENTAKKYHFSREAQDEYAKRSMELALYATENGLFKDEITPVEIQTRKETLLVEKDENPESEKLQKISQLKPAFHPEGTVTAANSSSISDGAASLILTTAEHAKDKNIKPLARIVAHASHANAPEWFTTAPVQAIQNVLKKANWTIDDVDLFEINEAFAVVTMAAIEELELPLDRVNIHGGACALGHPIGASGARILTTLIYALKSLKKTKGIASLCIGGGEAVAIAIEILNESETL